jgi:hypothetical protein
MAWRDEDFDRAREYFEVGARSGQWKCMFAFATILLAEGKDNKALEWLRLAGKQDGAIQAFVTEALEDPHVFDRWSFCREIPQFRRHLFDLAVDGYRPAIRAFWIAARVQGDADLVMMQIERMREVLDPTSETHLRDHVEFCWELGSEWVQLEDLEKIFILTANPNDAFAWYKLAWSKYSSTKSKPDCESIVRARDAMRDCSSRRTLEGIAQWHRERGDFEAADALLPDV